MDIKRKETSVLTDRCNDHVHVDDWYPYENLTEGSDELLPFVAIYAHILHYGRVNAIKVMDEIDTTYAFSLLFVEIYCRNGENVL